MKAYTALLIVAVATLMIACGPVGQNAPAQAGSSGTAQVNDAAQQKEAAPTAAGGALEAFKKSFLARDSLAWKIAYDVAATAEGNTVSSKMTQYLKGAQNIRIDMTASGVDSRIYMVDTVVTSCTSMGGGWNCMKLNKPEDKTKEMEDGFKKNPADYDITSEGSRRIAGYDTSCYKMLQKSNTWVVHYCFTSDGMPLYTKTEGTAGGKSFVSEMTATSVSKSVSDSDFVPPAEAKAVGGTPAPVNGAAPADPCAACGYLSGDQKTQCLTACGG